MELSYNYLALYTNKEIAMYDRRSELLTAFLVCCGKTYLFTYPPGKTGLQMLAKGVDACIQDPDMAFTELAGEAVKEAAQSRYEKEEELKHTWAKLFNSD